MSEAREHQKIVVEGRALYLEAIKHKTKERKLWAWDAPHMREYWRKTNESLKAVVFFAQEEPHISVSHQIFSRSF